MRIACIYIHNIAVQLARANDPELVGPLIVGGMPFEAGTVADASNEAIACGVKQGMVLRQAYSLCPDAKFLPPNKAACEEVFWRVLDVLDRFSPTVDVEKPGCVYVDVTGVLSENELAIDISRTILSVTRLSSCVGVSRGKFFAWAAAFTSRPAIPAMVAHGAEKEFIAPFSIEFLPCLQETKEHLRLLGVQFIGQLSLFPREALVAQFSLEGERLFDLAMGIDRTPLVPQKRTETAVDAIEFYPPVEGSIEVLKSCQAIVDKLVTEIRSRGKVCREVWLSLKSESGLIHDGRLPLKEASASEPVILRRIDAWLQGIQLPSPVSGIEIALHLTGETCRKVSLWRDFREDRRLMRAAQELKTRFGYQPLKKVEVVDHGAILPERRSKLVEFVDQESES